MFMKAQCKEGSNKGLLECLGNVYSMNGLWRSIVPIYKAMFLQQLLDYKWKVILFPVFISS